MNQCQIIPVNMGMVSAFLVKGENGKCVLVDCGVPGSEKTILKKMAGAGIKPEDIQLLIITHGHADHMGTASAIRRITGAKTVIHKLDADAIRSGKSPAIHPTNRKGRILGRFIPEGISSFEPYEPEIVIDGEMSLQDYGIPGKIVETPGHTNGSVSILLEDGSAFVGDAIIGAMIGKGKPEYPMYADSMEDAENSIQMLLALPLKMVYVGHGGPFTGEEIKKIRRIP
jgi:glyoxylase-like metal-dependent hydrolase (beta-lactamase superfamily II)